MLFLAGLPQEKGSGMNPLIAQGRPRALLVLEDGTVYEGQSCGAEGEAFGELVFNTAMSGYQEVVSDPSYAGQIVCFTYPQIGNYGTCAADMQSERLSLAGVVVRDMCCARRASSPSRGWTPATSC
jgi:carbamoyl-phosphate synthase small subunit